MSEKAAKALQYVLKKDLIDLPDTDSLPGKLQAEFDEAMLRIYVYGGPDERENCDMIERVLKGEAASKKFNTKFAMELIAHITKCENCMEFYKGRSKEIEHDRT